MKLCRIARLAKIIEGLRGNLDEHGGRCGDRVVGFAFSVADVEELGLCEIWGLKVFACGDVAEGRVTVLCDACGSLIPEFATVDDVVSMSLEHPDRGRFDPSGSELAA